MWKLALLLLPTLALAQYPFADGNDPVIAQVPDDGGDTDINLSDDHKTRLLNFAVPTINELVQAACTDSTEVANYNCGCTGIASEQTSVAGISENEKPVEGLKVVLNGCQGGDITVVVLEEMGGNLTMVNILTRSLLPVSEPRDNAGACFLRLHSYTLAPAPSCPADVRTGILGGGGQQRKEDQERM